jgi:hypothetical protein
MRKENPMKLKPGFDDEFQRKRKARSWPVRSIGRLMIVVAVSGAALSVMTGMGKQKRNSRYFPARVQRPIQAPRPSVLAAKPADPFVVVAAAEIDARMVVAAPVGIDEAMVFNPYTGERQSADGAPTPGSHLMPFPETQPGQLPDDYFAPRVLPQWPAPAQPR